MTFHSGERRRVTWAYRYEPHYGEHLVKLLSFCTLSTSILRCWCWSQLELRQSLRWVVFFIFAMWIIFSTQQNNNQPFILVVEIEENPKTWTILEWNSSEIDRWKQINSKGWSTDQGNWQRGNALSELSVVSTMHRRGSVFISLSTA